MSILYLIVQICCFLLALGTLAWARRKFTSVETYWQKGVIVFGLSIIMIHTALWWRFPVFWPEWLYQWGFAFYQIALFTGIYLAVAWGSKKFIRPFGVIILVLGLIGIGTNLWDTWKIARDVSRVLTLPSVPWDPSWLDSSKRPGFENRTVKFWNSHRPKYSAQAMISIVRRTSGFRHLDSEAKGLNALQAVYRNRAYPGRVGVMMLEEEKWAERMHAEGMNIYSFDDNLEAANWIVEREGLKSWLGIVGVAATNANDDSDSSAGAKKVPASEFVYLAQPGQTLTVSAPVGGVGEKVVLPTGVCAKEEPKGRVMAAINGGSPTYERWPGNVPKIHGKTYSVRYQSAGETPSEVSLGFYICAARP